MKKAFTLFLFFLAYNFVHAQSITKQQALDALKETLQGQIRHYSYGAPCDNSSGSSYRNANSITVKNVKLDYDQMVIEYFYLNSDDSQANNIARINMNNYLVSYENAIFESKIAGVDNAITCKNFINRALTFDDNAKAGQEKALKILIYLKKFIVKDPFN